MNDTVNGKDSGVAANVTPFGVGANVTPGVGANVTPVPLIIPYIICIFCIVVAGKIV